jgi:protein-S-isoprenylcysteine O-methyltransferase Ste14
MRLFAEIGNDLFVASEYRFLGAAIFAMLGLGLMMSGVFSFRKAQTTVNPLLPESASRLVDTGVFRFTRNPMYLGMSLITIAWLFYLSNPWSAFGCVGFVIYINQFQIKPEEKAMFALFGKQYLSYKNKVRRWI